MVRQSLVANRKNENDSSDGNELEEQFETKNKEINSWDRSSSDADDLKPKTRCQSDWDDSSECNETRVQPFEDNVPLEQINSNSDVDDFIKPEDDEDDSDGISDLNNGIINSKIKPISGSGSSLDSLGLPDLNEVKNRNLFDMLHIKNLSKTGPIFQNPVEKNAENDCHSSEEDSLLLEDVEEYMKEESTGDILDAVAHHSQVASNDSKDTPDETTVWMIPKSNRVSSTDSISKYASTTSEKDNIEKFKRFRVILKKAKSSSNVERQYSRRDAIKSSRSEIFHHLDSKSGELSNLSMIWEGSSFLPKPIAQLKDRQKTDEIIDEPRVYFAEYECRTVMMDNDEPRKTSQSALCNDEERNDHREMNNDDLNNTEETETDRNDESHHNLMLAGPSTQTSLEVVSLPDILGRSSPMERLTKDKFTRRINTPGKTRTELELNAQLNSNSRNESWFLLDETGHYQAITRDEVSILLNGRSADAVLQGHKEHFIQSSTLPDINNQKGSLDGVITKESIQNILREEDVGGEGQERKPIDLERKVENTLLYIQPGINLTASIRIIPVDTEMIHIWRRGRDNGSLLSSEVDLRLQTSQDSVDNPNSRIINEHHVAYLKRLTREKTQQTVTEQDENSLLEFSNGNSLMANNKTDVPIFDYSKLLIETRMIVDNLTNSFKILQNRLDGETNRNSALQEEVKKLRKLLGGPTDRLPDDYRETFGELHQSNASFNSMVVIDQQFQNTIAQDQIMARGLRADSQETASLSPSNETELSKENINSDKIRPESDYITVNIYTVDENLSPCDATVVQETNSLLQNNLGIIEGKMKRLEEENDVITKQNAELKEKLREISIELEKYLMSTTEADASSDEDKNVDALRDQVCNLILELDNLKKTARKEKRDLEAENTLIKEKLKTNLNYLEEWLAMSDQVFREVENLKSKLGDSGIIIKEDSFSDFDAENIGKPRYFSFSLNALLRSLTGLLIAAQNENWIHEKTMKKSTEKTSANEIPSKANKEEFKIHGNEVLNEVVSGYNKLIEQCRRGALNLGDDILNDYFTVIMEKASLLEEIKILKTENQILVQNDEDYHNKLKQIMITLKERSDEIESFKKAQKLSEEERNRMVDMLKTYENERKLMDENISDMNLRITELMEENKVYQLELQEKSDNLKAAVENNKNLEKSCQLKEDIINKFKVEKEKLLRIEDAKTHEIEVLKAEINDLELYKTQIESEIASTKLLTNQTQMEMTEYIKHLETMVSNSQEAIEKNKQKLKEYNQNITKLKTENEALEKQYQCDLKLFNNTKQELVTCREQCINMTNKYKQVEEEKEKLCEKFQSLSVAEKKASEALNFARKECKILQTDNTALKERMNIYSKDRDESLKEQKDLINKYAILSRELHKLQEKYRNVKAECNDRTNVIQCLEMMLKENSVDYNNKIAYLENNISHILDKIVACKHSMKEKHIDADFEVRELREQLNILYNERKELEKIAENYGSIVKHLEDKICDREQKVDELQTILSQEQHKWLLIDHKEIDRKLEMKITKENEEKTNFKNLDYSKMEQLENDIFTAENELKEYKKKLEQSEIKHESEKKKLELNIADLKSEINRYQLRIKIMMKNLSQTHKNLNIQNFDKRKLEEIEKKLHIAEENMEAKDEKISKLNEYIAQCKSEVNIKNNQLETLKKKNFYMSEMLKNLQDHISKIEKALSSTNRCNEKQEKEKNEMAEKLLQSIKMIMEEKSARQTVELLSVEKEKTYKEQIDNLKTDLNMKNKNCSTLSDEMKNKKSLISKLQEELKRSKMENVKLKIQINQMNENVLNHKKWKEKELCKSNSFTQAKTKGSSPERLESCLRELKEIREVNLLLRKKEGEYQAKIVKLEDELRDARLLIKELEGGIKIEKKSKKALRNMIMSAKMEINTCLSEKQIISMVADRINRHLEVEEIQYLGFRGHQAPHFAEN